MSAALNEQTILLALGILQPASAAEVRGYLHQMFQAAGLIPSIDDFKKFFAEQEKLGRVLTVSSGKYPKLSLTYFGSECLAPSTRRSRDKLRLYLLRDAHRRRMTGSRAEVAKELAGVSPAIDFRLSMKGREANELGLRLLGQVHWPRISKQFFGTGSSPSVRDALPTFVSFFEPWQLRRAADMGHVGPLPDSFEWNFKTLGTAFGISPGLITQIVRRPTRHYRTFEIRKSSGGARLIESPRIFLKVIQWLLNDFILMPRLPVSDANHAFLSGRTIMTNAQYHSSSRFVGNTDISQFFNSIQHTQIIELLRFSSFTEGEAALIAALCTKDGHLPQGAPTSPLLSNSLLFEFDEWFKKAASILDCNYSRYADDITVSGPRRDAVASLLAEAEGFLFGRYKLSINHGKTRISSTGGRQVVTGAVVNIFPQPPREYRKKIRAIFDAAKKRPEKFAQRLAELNGYVSYLGQFSSPPISKSIGEYRSVLKFVKEKSDAGKTPSRATKPPQGI